MDDILATIRRIISEDEQASTPSAAVGATARARSTAAASGRPEEMARLGSGIGAAAEDDVLELTAALNEDGTVRHLAPIGASSYRAERGREPPPPAIANDSDRGLEPEPEPRRDAPSVPRGQEEPFAPDDERLVSEATSLAAAAAFARLAAAPRAPRETPLVGDRPLDDVVQDLLRPLLQTWLDENLPALVERLVRAEIARVTSRSGQG